MQQSHVQTNLTLRLWQFGRVGTQSPPRLLVAACGPVLHGSNDGGERFLFDQSRHAVCCHLQRNFKFDRFGPRLYESGRWTTWGGSFEVTH